MTCTGFRSVEGRIRWFLNNSPGAPGMCARHSWRSLGGDRGCPPAWGTPHANAVYDNVIRSGRYWTGAPPRGALVLWKYGKFGHAAIALGGGRIATTDPSGKPGGVGIEPISYPSKWGATRSRRIWTDTYNGVRFGVQEEDSMAVEYKYLGKPKGDLVVRAADGYKRVDQSRWSPKHEGWQHVFLYLNIGDAVLAAGQDVGYLRIRLMRETTKDPTAYLDVPVHRGKQSTLITHTYWETTVGDKQPVHWQVKCRKGLEKVTIGTRYAKGAVVH